MIETTNAYSPPPEASENAPDPSMQRWPVELSYDELMRLDGICRHTTQRSVNDAITKYGRQKRDCHWRFQSTAISPWMMSLQVSPLAKLCAGEIMRNHTEKLGYSSATHSVISSRLKVHRKEIRTAVKELYKRKHLFGKPTRWWLAIPGPDGVVPFPPNPEAIGLKITRDEFKAEVNA